MKRTLRLHLTVSILLYLIFASLDVYFTLKGIRGDVSLEGNPLMRYMMLNFGLQGGLIIEKCLVFLIALMLAIIAFIGIDKKANWVYYLALTPFTRNWMKQKRRYGVAFVPLYFVAISQGVAAGSWIYLMS